MKILSQIFFCYNYKKIDRTHKRMFSVTIIVVGLLLVFEKY